MLCVGMVGCVGIVGCVGMLLCIYYTHSIDKLSI